MAKENTRERRLKLIFGLHPKADQFHVTSDDQAFEKKSLAEKHAETLRKAGLKGDVSLVKRSDIIKGGKPAADAGKEPANAKTAKSDGKESDTESLAALNKIHEELFGKAPAKNAKPETIKAKIDAEIAKRAAELGEPDAGEGAGSDEED